MSEYTGYHGNSLEFLKTNKILTGSSIAILFDFKNSNVFL